MNTVLSGERLVHAHGKTDHEMPQTGLKEFQPSNSWLEQKQIQSALEQRKTLLEEERVEKWNLLMKAKWVPEKHKAEVTQKGKSWEVFGHHSDNTDWLFPEEVLFLMETNCLECLFGEVPLSIQRGHTVLLDPEHGCSVNEYRVYSHLCRAGYRVVRHLSNLTVTAYERQIRLDQHLDQKKTYDESTTSSESETLRLDLPPKKILDLMENTEIVIDPSSLPHRTAKEKALEEKKVNAVEKLMEVVEEPIEVITLEDSSSEESAGEESSSDDSAIEIIGEFIPFTKTTSGTEIKKDEEDDDDIEIIEVPVLKKEIVVATIESSDGENKNDASDSGSEKSYDGNWKRNRPKNKEKRFVRPRTMSNLRFLSIDEFCVDRFVGSKEAKSNAQTNEKLNESDVSNDNVDTFDSVEYLSLAPSSDVRTRSMFPVRRTRNEILDLMPTMAHQKNKLMTLNTPDLRLVPNTIEPKQDSYVYNTYALRAKSFSNFRPFRGRRYFHGSRFNSYNPYYNTTHAHFDQSNLRSPLIQNPSLTQLFGSDIHSMARGMLQFASALIMNAPNNQVNGVSSLMSISQNNQTQYPFNSHANLRAHDTLSISQSQTFFDEPPRNFSPRSHNRFSDSSFSASQTPVAEIIQPSFRNRSFGRDHSMDSRHSRVSGDSDFNSRERTYTPPARTRPRGQLNGRSRRPFSRNHSNPRGAFAPAPKDSMSKDSVLPLVDPAYVKNDIPLPGNLNLVEDGSGNFIPIIPTNQNPVEIIDIMDTEVKYVPKSVGISQRFTRKQKRKIKQRMRVAKKRRLNQQSVQNKVPEVILLDSPSSSNQYPDAVPVKQESGASSVDIKTENFPTQNTSVKQEGNENISEVAIKNESTDNVLVKREKSIVSGQEPRVKAEENSDVSVKLEHDSGGNLQVEIKIESSSDTSSVNSLPVTSQVKEEPVSTIKSEINVSSETESLNNIKIEPVTNMEEVKTEIVAEDVQNPNCSVPLVTTVVQNSTPLPIPEETSADSVVEKPSEVVLSKKSFLETETSEKVSEIDISRTTESNESVCNEINSEMEVDVPCEILDVNSLSSVQISDQQLTPEVCVMNIETSSSDVSCEILRSTLNKTSDSQQNESSSNKESNWAEIKKNNVPLVSFQENQEECSNEGEEIEDDEIQPLIKPKHCKTIGTVLSALQIFSPFSPNVPEHIQKLKISFDMYLATDFRKSQRGLPQFRIAVFSGTESFPSPAQLQELQTRFKDQVPVLRAVVMPDSVVFYSCSNVLLPVDDTVHRE